MDADELVFRSKDIIYTMLMVVSPVMIASFVVGLLMSFLQAIFQIHEYTFSFVPKLLAILLSLIVAAPWMLDVLRSFSIGYLGGFSRYAQ